MNETVGLVVLGIGAAFNVFGCIGLVRLPDVYNRLQAATKCVTAGTCLIVIGSLLHLGSGPAMVKGLLIILFILMTSPTAAHALARGAHWSGVALSPRSVVDRYAEARARPSDSGTDR